MEMLILFQQDPPTVPNIRLSSLQTKLLPLIGKLSHTEFHGEFMDFIKRQLRNTKIGGKLKVTMKAAWALITSMLPPTYAVTCDKAHALSV